TSANEGSYRVVIANYAGTVSSSPVALRVLTPVLFGNPLVSQTVTVGSPVTLDPGVGGTPPLAFQWFKNGVVLPGATGPTLVLPAVQLSDGGSYTVVAANEAGSSESGPALLAVDLPDLALTDHFADRQVFTDASFVGSTNNLAATVDPGEPRHAGKAGGKSLWMTWRAPASGVATFRTVGSAFDTLLAVYTGTSVEGLAEVASDEDRGGFLTSELHFNAVAGTDYQVAVDGFAGASGQLVLGWNLDSAAAPLPVISGQPADTLSPLGLPVAFSVIAGPPGVTYQWWANGAPLAGATQSTLLLPGISADAAGTYSVRVTAPGGGTLESREALLEITSGIDAGTAALSANKLEDLFADNPVGPVGAAGRAAALEGVGRPAGFASLALGTANTQFLNLTGATTEPGDPAPCDVIAGGSRWFRFRVRTACRFALATTNSSFDSVLAVFTNRFALAQIACNDDVLPGGKTSLVVFNAQPEVDYLVAVTSKRGETGACGLTWRTTSGEEADAALQLDAVGVGDDGHFQFRRTVVPGVYDLGRGSGVEAPHPLMRTNVRSGLFLFRDTEPVGGESKFYRLAPAVP
ncbi:MAG: hypothetical protein DVB31_15540, partial [Verrucomicrobia bacterium]